MRAIAFGLMLFAVANDATAQVMTNCNHIGVGVNCTTFGPEGTSMTNCNRVGPSVNCMTTGNSFAPSTAATTTNQTANDSGGGGGAGVAAGAALGVLAIGGIAALVKAHREKVRQDRAARVLALVNLHQCDDAVALADHEHDAEMAKNARSMCVTAAQAGEEPQYLRNNHIVADRLTWVKTNLHVAAGSVLLGATDDQIVVLDPAKAAAGSAWIHQEVTSEQGKAGLKGRSQLILVAFDCPNQRFAIQASTIYAGQNLTGLARSDDRPSPYSVIRPGSAAELWSQKVCARTQADAGR